VVEEKRRTPRIQPFVAPCRYVLGEQRVPGFLTTLSRGGGRLQTEASPPAVGTRVTLEARLGHQALPVRLVATVRWVGSSPRGGNVFGVSFDGIGPEEQRVLDGVVAEFERRAASIE
jgi:PilZ domain